MSEEAAKEPKKQEFQRVKVEEELVILDGGIFHHRDFLGCNIVYRGGTIPLMAENSFLGCAFTFEDGAGRTVDLLRALAGNDGGLGLVLSILGVKLEGEGDGHQPE